jgi:hypothetical protein
MKFSFLILALALEALSGLCSAADDSAELAVVVSKATPVATVSLGDLRLMLLGEKSKWADGMAVIAVQTPPQSPERELQSKTVSKMSDAALKRYYMLAIFNGKEIAIPKDVASVGALKKFVAGTPGAIGCILATEVDDTVKVLKVDGSAPGDSGYKLR